MLARLLGLEARPCVVTGLKVSLCRTERVADLLKPSFLLVAIEPRIQSHYSFEAIHHSPHWLERPSAGLSISVYQPARPVRGNARASKLMPVAPPPAPAVIRDASP
jgi:hypothetical protein